MIFETLCFIKHEVASWRYVSIELNRVIYWFMFDIDVKCEIPTGWYYVSIKLNPNYQETAFEAFEAFEQAWYHRPYLINHIYLIEKLDDIWEANFFEPNF